MIREKIISGDREPSEAELKEARRIIASVNGRKGMSNRWKNDTPEVIAERKQKQSESMSRYWKRRNQNEKIANPVDIAS